MLNVKTIEKYLLNNGIKDHTGYLLKDKGKGNFIARWDYEISKPTKLRLAAIAKTLAEEQEAVAYINKRREAYPDIGDQLDAIWMQLNFMRLEGTNLVQDADDMLGQILQVKKDFSKPDDS